MKISEISPYKHERRKQRQVFFNLYMDRFANDRRSRRSRLIGARVEWDRMLKAWKESQSAEDAENPSA